MRTWQLAWVLVGVAVAIVVIAALVRALLRGGRGRELPPAQAAPQTPDTAHAPEPEGGPSGRTSASPAHAAGARTGSPTHTHSYAELPEQREARLQILQRLQMLAFGLAPSPAPDSAAAARAAALERADAAGRRSPGGHAGHAPAGEPAGRGPGAAAAAAPSAGAPSPHNASAEHEEVAATIRHTLLGIADRPNYAPRRPLLLPKLMQAMNDDEVSRRELARIIGTDPALAGNLLRLANSPFYRLQPDPVESLDRAIALLGLEGMRSLIAAALLQPVFRISGGMFLQFGEVTWEHTLYSAAASEAHAAVLENSDPFAAQLLALVMGLATIVVFRVATDEFLARQVRPNATALAALIDLECAAVARRIAASWELSERIDTALVEQSLMGGASPASALGRSLQIGRYLGALALLHVRAGMDEEEVTALLKSAGARADAYGRIWARLVRSAT